jgi:hypothetical protein
MNTPLAEAVTRFHDRFPWWTVATCLDVLRETARACGDLVKFHRLTGTPWDDTALFWKVLR